MHGLAHTEVTDKKCMQPDIREFYMIGMFHNWYRFNLLISGDQEAWRAEEVE
jgi:hypothetical protein